MECGKEIEDEALTQRKLPALQKLPIARRGVQTNEQEPEVKIISGEPPIHEGKTKSRGCGRPRRQPTAIEAEKTPPNTRKVPKWQ